MSESKEYQKASCDENLQDQVDESCGDDLQEQVGDYLSYQAWCKMRLELTKQRAHEAVALVDLAYRKMKACKIGFWLKKISFGILAGLIVVIYTIALTALFGHEFDFAPLKIATFYLWVIATLVCLGVFWGSQKYYRKATDDFYAMNREACETMNSMIENRRKAEHLTYAMADIKEKNPQIMGILGSRDELDELRDDLKGEDVWHDEYQYVRSHAIWQQDWRKSLDRL